MRDNNRENEPTKKKNNGLALHKMLTRVSVGHQLDRFYNITDNNERGSNFNCIIGETTSRRLSPSPGLDEDKQKEFVQKIYKKKV